MHVAGEHDLGSVLGHPRRQIAVAVVSLARPRRGRVGRRPVVHPHPRGRPPGTVASELVADGRLAQVAVPPRAHGDQRVADLQRTAIDDDAVTAEGGDPRCALLTVGVGRRQVVVARAHHHRRAGPHELHVAGDHDALRVERHCRRDVEVVARHHHEVELVGVSHDPVELGQVVVEVGDEQEAHGGAPRTVSTPVVRRAARARSARSPTQRGAARELEQPLAHRRVAVPAAVVPLLGDRSSPA